MEGQISLFTYQKERERRSYRITHPIEPISKRWWDEEGWSDKFHYTDEETPEDNGIYCARVLHNGFDFLNSEYALYQDGKWYVWDSWFKVWTDEFEYTVIGYARIPSKYERCDAGLQTRYEAGIRHKKTIVFEEV